jgi:uncharacterized membrane-anchored protein
MTGMLAPGMSKVPEVTAYFWVIKILSATVGQNAADLLDRRLDLGVGEASWVVGGFAVLALGLQLSARRYAAPVFWTTTVVVGVAGTLVTDDLTDLGFPLWPGTAALALGLVATLAGWYTDQHTLSLRSVTSGRREAWYWCAVLLGFALGAAVGDLLTEQLAWGDLGALLALAALIALATLAHARHATGGVLTFWLVYVLTQPLGVALGNVFAHATKDGGLGMGSDHTSVVFGTAVLVLVGYLAVTGSDVVENSNRAQSPLG